MSKMIINRNTLQSYRAIFVSFLYSLSTFESSVFTPSGNYEPTSKSLSIACNKMELTLVFEHEIDLSNFTALLIGDVIIDLDDKMQYHCYLVDTPVIKHIGCRIYQVSYPLLTVKKGDLVIKKLHDVENIIYVGGNLPCPCKYTIKPKMNITTLMIDGFMVKNLKVNTTVILDGMKKFIFENGVNKFNDLVLKDNMFPILHPGTQYINISNIDADVSLEFYPIYL